MFEYWFGIRMITSSLRPFKKNSVIHKKIRNTLLLGRGLPAASWCDPAVLLESHGHLGYDATLLLFSVKIKRKYNLTTTFPLQTRMANILHRLAGPKKNFTGERKDGSRCKT
jgi:hypothetical protein